MKFKLLGYFWNWLEQGPELRNYLLEIMEDQQEQEYHLRLKKKKKINLTLEKILEELLFLQLSPKTKFRK